MTYRLLANPTCLPLNIVLTTRPVHQWLTLWLFILLSMGGAGLLSGCAIAETGTADNADGGADSSAQANTPSAPLDPEQIRALQRRLQALRYNPGPVDGVIGARTTSAVRAFQSRAGLAPNGVIDQALLARLQQSDAPPFPADASNTAKGNTTVTGPLTLRHDAAGKLTGCAINDVSFDLSWCQPFAQKKPNDDATCKAVLRPNGQVLLLRCG